MTIAKEIYFNICKNKVQSRLAQTNVFIKKTYLMNKKPSTIRGETDKKIFFEESKLKLFLAKEFIQLIKLFEEDIRITTENVNNEGI